MDTQAPLTFTRSAEYRYAIKAEESYGMYSGHTQDGRQVLMGLYWPEVVAIFFDKDGRLLDVQTRRLSFLKPQEDYCDIYDPRITEDVGAWQEELGFEFAIICLQKFFVLDDPKFMTYPPWMRNGIGIEDYSTHFADVLMDPNEPNEEKDGILESLKSWDEEGQFVLWWGNDYWLNKDGEFVAS